MKLQQLYPMQAVSMLSVFEECISASWAVEYRFQHYSRRAFHPRLWIELSLKNGYVTSKNDIVVDICSRSLDGDVRTVQNPAKRYLDTYSVTLKSDTPKFECMHQAWALHLWACRLCGPCMDMLGTHHTTICLYQRGFELPEINPPQSLSFQSLKHGFCTSVWRVLRWCSDKKAG